MVSDGSVNEQQPRSAPPRQVGFPLGVGIFFLPYVFAWFLLRQGYSAVARFFGFGWMALILLMAVSLESAPKGGDQTANSDGSVASSGGGTVASSNTGRSFGDSVTDAMVNPGMSAITAKVARDAVDQFNIAVSGGDGVEICVHAGLVAAAYIQAKDQANFLMWKATQRRVCRAAGLPQY